VTEADGARYSWTVTDKIIFGGGVLFEKTETEEPQRVIAAGDHWQSYTPGNRITVVSDELPYRTNLTSSGAGAATYKASEKFVTDPDNALAANRSNCFK